MKKYFLIAALIGASFATNSSYAACWRPFGGLFRFRCASCSTCSPCEAQKPCAPCQAVTACGTCANGTCAIEYKPTTNMPEACSAVVDQYEQVQSECAPCVNAESSSCEPCAAVECSAIERRLIDVANRVRGDYKLTFDANCQELAKANSYQQASRCLLGHFTGNPREIAGYGYGSAEAAINGWLGSGLHRAHLLNCKYTKVGASVYRGRDGYLYWTMCFGQ